MHKVADGFVYLCMIGAVPGARKHISFSCTHGTPPSRDNTNSTPPKRYAPYVDIDANHFHYDNEDQNDW